MSPADAGSPASWLPCASDSTTASTASDSWPRVRRSDGTLQGDNESAGALRGERHGDARQGAAELRHARRLRRRLRRHDPLAAGRDDRDSRGGELMAVRNVTTRLLGRTIRFMECPNPELSGQLARIEGVYLEDGKLMLIGLF